MSKETQIVETLIERSANYTCGNIDYRRENTHFYIWSAKSTSGSFYPTGMVVELGSFSSYCMYNSKEERVELVIIAE